MRTDRERRRKVGSAANNPARTCRIIGALAYRSALRGDVRLHSREVLHFIGLILLIGTVGMFDLRVLGLGRGLPLGRLRRILPLGVLGFVLCVVTGAMFVGGVYANVEAHPYVVLVKDVYLQWKLLFIFVAGVNLLLFYLTGASRAVDHLRPEDDAPLLAKLIGATSLFLWLGVIYFGRLIPWALP